VTLADLRALNAVFHEDAETITASAPCPTYTHRPEKVAPEYLVTFRCPAGESTTPFCGPCTADRRAGRFGCSPDVRPDGGCPDGCEGSRVVRVRTFVPRTIHKAKLAGASDD